MDAKNVVDSQFQGQNRIDRGLAIAAVIQSVPHILWVSLVSLTGGFIALALWFNYRSLEGFTSQVLLWLVRILIAIGVTLLCIALYKCYKVYHTVIIQGYERRNARAVTERQQLMVERQRLQNEQLKARVEMELQLPLVMKYAMEAGHNIEWDAKGGLKVQNYLSNVHSLSSVQDREQIAAPAPSIQLPAPYKFSDVLQNWAPTKDGILLAKEQSLITVPLGEALCHTTFTGNTDAGKTNDERMLLIQLLYLEQIVYLCDRNYQRYRMDKKQNCYYDYEPIAAQLSHEPIDKAPQVLALLQYLYSELEDRRARRKHNLVQFPDIYLVMDELPAFCADEPKIMQYVGRFLRESRQYGIFFIGAANDLLNSTLNNDNGAIRDNLLTNFYGGGDMTTAKMVLNIPKGKTIDETGLGKQGTKYLRAKGADIVFPGEGIEYLKVRTPLSDDRATQMLLAGRAPRQQQHIPMPRVVTAPPVVASGYAQYEDDEECDTDETPSLSGDLLTVYEAFQELISQGERTSSRAVQELTGFGKDKANSLLNELANMGYIKRK